MKAITNFFNTRKDRFIASPVFWLILLLAIFSAKFVYGHSSVSDWFYLPGNTSAINIHKAFALADWQNSNWFTFGTEGHQEVTVYGQYVNNMLYFAFIVRDDSLIENKDKVTICIDSTNSGSASVDNYLIKIDLVLKNSNSTPIISTCHLSCTDETGWTTLGNPQNYADGYVYSDAFNNYWQGFLKIDCSTTALGHIVKEGMGLCFQVLDYTTDYAFTVHQWPHMASGNTADPGYVPPATEWANAHWIQSSSVTRPDVYFRPNDLRTDNLPNDLEIKSGQDNKILTKILNKYFAASSDLSPDDVELNAVKDDQGSVAENKLVFKYAEFGVDCFVPLDSLENTVVLANNTVDTNIVWDLIHQVPKPQSMLVTLRTEFTCAEDAITSDNIIHRDMQYLYVKEGSTLEFPVVITNCNGQIADISANTGRGRPILLAANGWMPAQILAPDSTETVYLYLDKSGLGKKGTLEGYWKIDLLPAAGDSIHPITGQNDRFYLKFAPGEKKKFKLRVSVPQTSTIQSQERGCCLWNPLGLFSSANKNELTETDLLAGRASTKSVMQEPPEIQRPHGYPASFFYRVYKPVQSYVVRDTTYHRMRTMGYFGVNLLVLPKPANRFWPFAKYFLGLLALSGGIYYGLSTRK